VTKKLGVRQSHAHGRHWIFRELELDGSWTKTSRPRKGGSGDKAHLVEVRVVFEQLRSRRLVGD
jgi:hypothetical protein